MGFGFSTQFLKPKPILNNPPFAPIAIGVLKSLKRCPEPRYLTFGC